MSFEFPEDWYEDIDGRSRMLAPEKVRAEIERLRKALVVARQWMPVHPIPNTGAVEDCAVVDVALGHR